jgi:hypothetical protein
MENLIWNSGTQVKEKAAERKMWNSGNQEKENGGVTKGSVPTRFMLSGMEWKFMMSADDVLQAFT